MLWIGKARKLMANRVTGDQDHQRDNIDISAPPDEEVITIPRSAVHSWRSSAASGMSSTFTTLSNFPMFDNGIGNGGRPMSARSTSAMSITSSISNDGETLRGGVQGHGHGHGHGHGLTVSRGRLPIFAPREGSSRMSGRYSALSYGRDSSVSSIMSARHGHSRSVSRNGPSLTPSPGVSPILRAIRPDECRAYRDSDVSVLPASVIRHEQRRSDASTLAPPFA